MRWDYVLVAERILQQKVFEFAILVDRFTLRCLQSRIEMMGSERKQTEGKTPKYRVVNGSQTDFVGCAESRDFTGVICVSKLQRQTCKSA